MARKSAELPEVGRREQNKLEKRERIRAAAERLFLKRGYDATTTREIAEAADVAAGTVFLYAGDKQDLLFLVMHERLKGAVDGAFATMPKRARLVDAWLHVFTAIYRLYGELEPLAHPFVRQLPGARGVNADLVNTLTNTFLARLALLVQEAQQRGEVRAEVEPLLAATTVFGLYFTALLAWLSGQVQLQELPEVLRGMLTLVFEGLRR
jgi:TetR/AcrR family transcriptional regulator, cholesterol catabolism regulator